MAGKGPPLSLSHVAPLVCCRGCDIHLLWGVAEMMDGDRDDSVDADDTTYMGYSSIQIVVHFQKRCNSHTASAASWTRARSPLAHLSNVCSCTNHTRTLERELQRSLSRVFRIWQSPRRFSPPRSVCGWLPYSRSKYVPDSNPPALQHTAPRSVFNRMRAGREASGITVVQQWHRCQGYSETIYAHLAWLVRYSRWDTSGLV